MPPTDAELRRPLGSDAAVAARVAVDHKVARLPARVAQRPLTEDRVRERLATAEFAAALHRGEPEAAVPAAAASRLPRGAGGVTAAGVALPPAATASPATPPAAVPPAAAPRQRSGIGRFILWACVLCLLPVLLAGTAAYLAATYLDEVRAGRSEIMFHLPELAGDAANRFLATQPVIVRSYPVVEPVARAEAMPVDDILDNLDVTMVQGSTLMRIEYQDVDSERIVRVLEALTLGYLSLLRDIALIEGASHRLLSAPYLLEDPVGPRPLRAAAIGAVVGLAVAFAGLVVLAQLRRPG